MYNFYCTILLNVFDSQLSRKLIIINIYSMNLLFKKNNNFIY